MKVFLGTAASIGAAISLFFFIRSKGEFSPRTRCVLCPPLGLMMGSPAAPEVHVQGVPRGHQRVDEGTKGQPYRESSPLPYDRLCQNGRVTDDQSGISSDGYKGKGFVTVA